MFNQMYYSAKNRLWMRLLMFAIVVIGGGFFMLAAMMGAAYWVSVLGIVFSAIAMMCMFASSIYVTATNFNSISKEPHSYLELLTPVPTWKKYLGAIIPATFFDVLGFAVGVFMVVMLSVQLGGESETDIIIAGTQMDTWVIVIGGVLLLFAYYALLLAIGLFGSTISRTVLVRVPLRKLVSVILTIVTVCALSWTNIVLLPLAEFGEIQRFGPLFNMNIVDATLWNFAAMAAVVTVQWLVLTFAAAFIMDRRS